MDVELEIEQGGKSDQIGKELEQSVTNYGQDLMTGIGVGAADVVASTGINVGVGNTDQIIADNIAAGLNLTGTAGLTNLSNNLQSYTHELAAMGLNAPEELVQLVINQLESLLAENGTLQAIQKGLEITSNTVDLAKIGLDYATKGATVLANMEKLLLKLNKMQDVDVTCVPSVKDTASALTASIILQIKAQYEALKQQLLVFFNAMICTSNDSVLDNIVISINNILEVTEPALDPILQENTGFTVSEVRNICNQGFAYIGMIERAAAKKRKEEEEEKQEAEKQEVENEENIKNPSDNIPSDTSINSSTNNVEDTFKKIGSNVSKEAKNLSKEAKAKLKKELVEKSKKKWEEKTKDLSKEEAKAKLMEWLKDQSIIIQNAFHILVIKDTIEYIKTFLSQLQNTSIENQVDLLNMLSDILSIFEMLGITPDAQGITIDDLKALGMGVAGTIVDTAVNIGQQVQNNATAATQQLMEQGGVGDVVGGARNTVATMTNKISSLRNDLNSNIDGVNNTVDAQKNKINNAINSADNVGESDNAETGVSTRKSSSTDNLSNENVQISGSTVGTDVVKAVGSDIVAGMTDAGINTIIDANLNLDMDAITNGGTEMLNDTINSFKNNTTKSLPAFTYTQSNKDKNINIDITINKSPRLHLIKVNSFIDSFKSDKKHIFNNGAKKQIKDAFNDAWDANETIELTIQTMVNGVTKFYIFTFNVNSITRNDPDINNEDPDIENKILNGGSSNANSQISLLSNNASNITNSGINTASSMIDSGANAVSQLTKVDVNIDMSTIEAVLQGKVLMFDPIVQILKVLLPLVDALTVICKLLQNYLINKEMVRTKQHVDLANAYKNAAQYVNGLLDIINLKDTNFFVVRTQEMADWVSNTFNKIPDTTGIVTIGILDTTVLNTYCAIHMINPDYPLDLLKGTTLYFDGWGIEHGGYNDGTSNGLDNVEINRALGEVYYDASQRSTISSEILRAKKKNLNYNYVNTDNESPNLESLLKLISFKSDEMEGTQTLNLCDLNLCPPVPDQIDNGNNLHDSAVIVEFGDEYTKGKRVDYNIVVKPGQAINKNDIIAYIIKDNKQYPIKTKYTGIVRSIDDNNTDYYHVYPNDAKRHFIIDDPVICRSDNYDINDVIDINQKFKKTIEIETFIINCLPISILPILLKNADRDNKPELQQNGTIPNIIDKSGNVLSKYNELVMQYDTTVDIINSSILDYSSESNIKPSTEENTIIDNGKKYSKIPIDTNKKIFDNIKKLRQEIIDAAISTYNDALSINDLIGEYTYSDCIGLAFDEKLEYKRGSNNDSDKQITNINYYLNLLQNIPESKDFDMPVIDMDDINDKLGSLYDILDENKSKFSSNKKQKSAKIDNFITNPLNNKEDKEPSYLTKYKQLIKNIIDTRLSLEEHTTEEIITQFNIYYNDKILNDGNSNNIMGMVTNTRSIENPYVYLNNYISEQNISIDNSQEILNKIKKDKLNLDNSADFNAILDKEKSLSDDKLKTYYNECQYVLTLFTYINTSNLDIAKVTYTTESFGSKLNKESSGTYIKESSKKYERSSEYSSKNDIAEENRNKNKKYFDLLKNESELIEKFWKEVLAEYYSNYNLDTAISGISIYANNMNSTIQWPSSINIKLGNTNYELYTFMDYDGQDKNKDVPTEILFPQDTGKIEIPDPTIDLNNLPDAREHDPITIMDYEYWLVYMLNATLFTLIPLYWGDGLDIPPFMIPTPLPAIYLPIAPPVMIPIVNVLMVFGIALRGIYPAPIILMVNLSSDDIDAMIVIKIALQIAKDIFKKAQEFVENTIPMMTNELIRQYLSENQVAQKAIDKFRTYASIIRAIPIEDKALIEKEFNEALQEELNKPSKLNQATGKLEKTKNKLKNYDRRQILTRESDLGNGPEPM